MLTLLKKVKFDGVGHCLWQLLPVHFHQVFWNCLLLPPMEDVCISYVEGFPLSTLNDCKSLRRLTLYQCDKLRGSLGDPVSRELSLESLSIQNCGIESLPSIIAWAPTCNLRSPEVSRIHGPDETNIQVKLPTLLAKCSNTLTSLKLTVDNLCMLSHCVI